MNATPSIEPIEVQLHEPPLSKGQREWKAFQRLLPELLKQYRGQYVAIHDEQVFDVGTDPIELSMRVRAKVGKVALYIGVVSETQPVYRISSPHIVNRKPLGES